MSEFAIFGVGRVDDFFEDNLQGDAFELRQHPASANPEPQLLHCQRKKAPGAGTDVSGDYPYGLPLVCISTILVINKPDSDESVLGVDYANLDKKDRVPEYRWRQTCIPNPKGFSRMSTHHLSRDHCRGNFLRNLWQSA